MEEALKIILGLCTVSLAIIALVQRQRFIEFKKKVVHEEGVFKKPTLRFGLFGLDDVETFIVAVPLKNKVWEVPLPINIMNTGEKAAEEIEVLYRINKELCYKGGVVPVIKEPGVKNAKIAQTNEEGPFVTVITSLTDIHPGQSITLNSIMSIRSGTVYPHNIRARTKDGVGVVVKTWLSYGYPFDLVVSQKEFKPIVKRFTIQTIDTSEETPEDFFSRYNEVLEKQYNTSYSELRLWEKIKKNISTSKSTNKIALVFCDTEKGKQKTYRVKGHKLVVHEVPTIALKVYQGIETEYGYIIPSITHEINNNRLTKKFSRPPSSSAD